MCGSPAAKNAGEDYSIDTLPKESLVTNAMKNSTDIPKFGDEKLIARIKRESIVLASEEYGLVSIEEDEVDNDHDDDPDEDETMTKYRASCPHCGWRSLWYDYQDDAIKEITWVSECIPADAPSELCGCDYGCCHHCKKDMITKIY